MSLRDYTPEQIEEILQAFFEVAGTRQYIGARYVPIFGRGRGTSVDWDGGADAYEPLSIVYWQGDTYTSRRYVPAGIDIQNTDYWVITGRYNAQVEQYRQEVLGFQGQIDGLRSDLESDYVPFPDPDTYPKYGTLGQVLTTLSNGETKWENPVVPSDAQAEEVIDAWLTAHPEATTTVQDRSLTPVKMSRPTIDSLQEEVFFANSLPSFSMSGTTLTIGNLSAIFVRRHETQSDAYVRYAQSVTTYTVANGYVLVWNASTHELSVESTGVYLDQYAVTLIWNHYGVIKGPWAHYYYESILNSAVGTDVTIPHIAMPTRNVLQEEIFFSNTIPTFALDGSNTLTITNLSKIFVRRWGTTSDSYYGYNLDVTTYTIPINNVLVWNCDTNTLEVKAAGTNIGNYAVTLIWNHYGVIKGLWAHYYYESKLSANISPQFTVNKKIMSRQGEGYGYPGNSLEAVSAALAGGYRNIRISTAHTADGIWYATHSYEMQNNTTLHCLTYKSDGTAYPNDLDINSTQSSLVNDLNYYGHSIPTLESVLKVCAMYDANVTIEMKDDISEGTVAKSLADLVTAYRPDAVFSGLNALCANICNSTTTKLNVAVIFHYTDAAYATVVASFITNDLAKSLRLDCYYGDTVSTSQMASIHEHATLKFGGSGITAAQAKEYLEYVDVVEYNLRYSTLATEI